MSLQKPDIKHIELRSELIAVLRKHSDKMSGLEILAIVSHFLGQVVALQDQSKMTEEIAMEVVMRNMQQGNQEIIGDMLMKTKGKA